MYSMMGDGYTSHFMQTKLYIIAARQCNIPVKRLDYYAIFSVSPSVCNDFAKRLWSAAFRMALECLQFAVIGNKRKYVTCQFSCS